MELCSALDVFIRRELFERGTAWEFRKAGTGMP
jgi:hypothetical protein